MKTKLWERTAFRIIIFLLCAVCFAGSVCLVMIGSERQNIFYEKNEGRIIFHEADVVLKRDFLESESFRSTVWEKLYDLMFLFTNDWVVDESGVSGQGYEREVENVIRNLYDNIRNEITNRVPRNAYEDYYEGRNYGDYTLIENWETYLYDNSYYWQTDSYGYENYDGRVLEFDLVKMLNDPVLFKDRTIRHFSEPGVREAFEALFPEQAKYLRELVEGSYQERYDNQIRQLAGMYYFVSDGGKVLSNVPLTDDGVPVDPEQLTSGEAWIVRGSDRTLYSKPPGLKYRNDRLSELGKAQLYLSIPDDTIYEYESLFLEIRGIILQFYGVAIALFVLAIVFFIMSIINTGRMRPAYEGTRKLWRLDKIFVEIQILLFFFTAIIGVVAAEALLGGYQSISLSGNGLYIMLVFAVSFMIIALLLWLLLSLVRIGKAGLFAERSLIGLCVNGPGKALADMIRSGYDGRNPLAKTIIFLILFWFLTALFAGLCGIGLNYEFGAAIVFFILTLLTLAGAAFFTSKWVERYGRLRRGVEEITSGNLRYQIDISGDGKNEFDRLSAMVNELGNAQNTAVQNELKNQRLKTDLITNVSHDLKTPLTSILTYTDLLKKEGLKSKDAEEYLKVIDEKGRRLQKLTEDLFDAAKASSGAITVRKDRVDMLALVNQEIAEMNGGFADLGLELVINADSEHYYVEADSQLLWRVVDNLLNNARKYAQPGTRIYIELKEQLSSKTINAIGSEGKGSAGMAQGGAGQGGLGRPLMSTMEIKNISASKLNIPPEELMERFKRGDEARATDGSGLGLAIAKDLVRLQGGWFEIFIDGDLFKAVIMLPPYTPEIV